MRRLQTMTWQNISTSRRVQHLRDVLGKEGHGKGWICSTSCKILYCRGSGEEDFKRGTTRFIARYSTHCIVMMMMMMMVMMMMMMMKIAGESSCPCNGSNCCFKWCQMNLWIFFRALAEPAKSYFAMCFFTLFAKLKICCSCRNLFVWRNFWRQFFRLANICKMSSIPVFCIFWRHFALWLVLWQQLITSWASKRRIWFSVSLSSCT